MGRYFGILLLAWVGQVFADAQASWAKFYGDNVKLDDFRLTSDGEMIVLGKLKCNLKGDCSEGEARPFFEEECATWVAKLDGAGEILWQRCYRSGLTASVLPTSDGGVLVVGKTHLDAPPWGGGLLLKLDAQGQVQWQKDIYVDLPYTRASLRSAVETQDGYVAIGEVENDNSKAWILSLDRNGELLWQKTLGRFLAATIQPTADGHFIVAGATNLTGRPGAWIMKMSKEGESLWQRSYEGEDLPAGWEDVFFAVDVQEALGAYWVAGVTQDAVPDPQGKSLPEFRARAWVAKLDREGHLQWRKVYGEELRFAHLRQVIPTADGGALALGAGESAIWLAKLDQTGEIVWQRLYGRDKQGEAFLRQGREGQLFLAGVSLLDTAGDWVLALDADGALPCPLAKVAAVSVRESRLFKERTLSYAESPPPIAVLSKTPEVSARRVIPVPACPASQALASCRQIQQAGQAYGDGRYPIVLKTPQGPEWFAAFCAMRDFGGGWMLIAGQRGEDRRPPAEFVGLRFGKYGGELESFSIWPDVDFSATGGLLGLSWVEDFQLKAGLLSDLSSEQLQAILATSPRVDDAWVR
ncbi:hypothetical protein JCM13664_06880 [Methylothermus subterraneus]